MRDGILPAMLHLGKLPSILRSSQRCGIKERNFMDTLKLVEGLVKERSAWPHENVSVVLLVLDGVLH